MLTERTIESVARRLKADLYEAEFRGKDRGRFCLSRMQLRRALGVERLHMNDILRLQDAALKLGLVIIDLDDLFPCVEAGIVRGYRRPPAGVFAQCFPSEQGDCAEDADDE